MTGDDGLTWRIEPAYEEAVQREILPRLDALAGAPGVETVKRNRVRTVLRLTLRGGPEGDEEVYLKRYHPTGARATAKSLVRASRARQEWAMATALEEAGIPTAHPIAWAERRCGRVVTDAAYLCRGIPGAEDLVPYLRERGDPALARRLLRRLAELARRQHDAGIDHPDLHSGNVLVTGEGEAAALHVIDLHAAARRAGPLGARRRIRRLGKLLHSLRGATSRSDRLRLVRAYAEGGRLPDADRAWRATERRIGCIERARRRSRTRRCLQEGRRYTVTWRDGFRIRRRRELDAGDLLAAVAEHDRRVAADDGVLKRSRRSVVTRETVGGARVVVKSMTTQAPRTWLGAVLGAARGRRSWIRGHALRVRGVAAARPIAYLVERRGPLVRREVLVMEDVSVGGERLDHRVLRLHREGTLHGAEGRALAEATARFVRDLDRGGIHHGDLKACNLYVQEGEDGAPAIRVVDYDRVRFGRGPVAFRRRVKTLAQLSASIPICVTRTDRLRFFRRAAPTGELARDWKRHGRAVAEACREKIVVGMEPIE